jgi:hypothetical protein
MIEVTTDGDRQTSDIFFRHRLDVAAALIGRVRHIEAGRQHQFAAV